MRLNLSIWPKEEETKCTPALMKAKLINMTIPRFGEAIPSQVENMTQVKGLWVGQFGCDGFAHLIQLIQGWYLCSGLVHIMQTFGYKTCNRHRQMGYKDSVLLRVTTSTRVSSYQLSLTLSQYITTMLTPQQNGMKK